jgi:hypothetical protein
VIPVGGELLKVVGEGDHDHVVCLGGGAEGSESVTHGDDMFPARQSSQVLVQDQHEHPAEMVGWSPWSSFVIDEGDIGEATALADHARRRHASARSASSTPRWNVG